MNEIATRDEMIQEARSRLEQLEVPLAFTVSHAPLEAWFDTFTPFPSPKSIQHDAGDVGDGVYYVDARRGDVEWASFSDNDMLRTFADAAWESDGALAYLMEAINYDREGGEYLALNVLVVSPDKGAWGAERALFEGPSLMKTTMRHIDELALSQEPWHGEYRDAGLIGHVAMHRQGIDSLLECLDGTR